MDESINSCSCEFTCEHCIRNVVMRGSIGPRVVDRIQKPVTNYLLGKGKKNREFRDHVVLEVLLIFKKYLPMVRIVRT